MYHSKRQKHNSFNLRKNAKKHNNHTYNIQKKEYIKTSRKKITNIFQNIISGCKYNEFKIDSKIHYSKFSYMRIIPKGKKGYVWFQTNNNFNSHIAPIFYFEMFKNRLQLLDNGNGLNICCNSQSLGIGDNGTILYGTFFKHNNVDVFNIEDIYYFQNRNISKLPWNEKFSIFSELFLKYIKQICYGKNDMLIVNSFTQRIPYDVVTLKNLVPFEIFSVQYLSEKSDHIHYKQELIQNNNAREEIFKIKACLNHDEYDIYTIDDNKIIGKLYVPDYKTSVFLNNIFRNIRENENLDLLEESDCEEDFENISLDKFVNLQMERCVKCIFDTNINMWKVKNVSNK